MKKVVHVDNGTIIYMFNKKLSSEQKSFRDYLEQKANKKENQK